MTRSFHHLRLPWIALAAVVGLLSMAGDSTACELKGVPKAARSCCAGRPSAVDCGDCCGPAGVPSSRPATVARLATPTAAGAGLVSPLTSCECRSGQPAAPAPGPESRPGPTRPDRDRVSEVAFAFEARAHDTFATLAPLRDGPSKTPLYLRTSRLLI